MNTTYQDKIENIRRFLFRFASKGEPKCFEIKFDDMVVVPKTTELEEFEAYSDFDNSDVKKIAISIYRNTTDKFAEQIHSFKVEQNNQPINGLAVMDNTATEKAIETKWELRSCQDEVEKLKADLKFANKYIATMEAAIEHYKIQPNYVGKFDLGKFCGSMLEGFMSNNPKWVAKVPMLNGVAEAITESQKDTPTELQQPTGEVSFKRKTDAVSELSDEHKSYIEFGTFFSESFTEKEAVILNAIIEELAKDASPLETIADLLNIDKSKIGG